VGEPTNKVFSADTKERVPNTRPESFSRSKGELEKVVFDEAPARLDGAEIGRVMTADEKARRERCLTVQQFGEAWTSGKLYERHGDVNGLRQKKSASNDAHRLAAYVYPLIGAKPVAEVAEEDIERILARAERKARRKLGRPWRKAARLQLYQVLRRLFDLAIRPGRLRADSPVSESLRPGRDDPKLFGFLNPSELLALLPDARARGAGAARRPGRGEGRSAHAARRGRRQRAGAPLPRPAGDVRYVGDAGGTWRWLDQRPHGAPDAGDAAALRAPRAARTLSDLDYKPFPDLAKAIPELAKRPANVIPIRRSRK
jgi:hypothetical protein